MPGYIRDMVNPKHNKNLYNFTQQCREVWEKGGRRRSYVRHRCCATIPVVPKKDDSWHPCGDYRHLKMVTLPDRYPLPNMQSLNNLMVRCTVFSKFDLVKVYHQIQIA
jgi:hypothetical protein